MHDPCKVLVTLDAVAHAAARRAASVAEGRCGIFVDATAGNGHDTVFLAELAGRTGHVYAFDVQTAALGATRNRLEAAGLADRVTLIHAGHENLAGLVPECTVTAILFNLGFLPGSDKRRPHTQRRRLPRCGPLFACLENMGYFPCTCTQDTPGGAESAGTYLNFLRACQERSGGCSSSRTATSRATRNGLCWLKEFSSRYRRGRRPLLPYSLPFCCSPPSEPHPAVP